MRIFIDTSAFYALLDRDDAHHSRAKKAWAELLKAVHTLVTSNYILVETFALLQNRLGIEAARAFHDDVLPLINVEFVASAAHRSGVAALLSASRRDLSLVDCVSFEVMRSSGINTAFAFDKHFKGQGFSTVA
jgi:predicted nucleic acid-binding protein